MSDTSSSVTAGTMTVTIKIDRPVDITGDEDNPRITDFSVVASYNWLDTFTPSILIPGIPPIWAPPGLPPALNPDRGVRYIDQNADRNPGSPLESLIHAVNTVQPKFDFDNINIITDRRPIRKLFGFVKGDHGKAEFGPDSAFKFGVRIEDNGTAMLTRIEEETREDIKIEPKYRGQGYRKAFEESYTKIAASGRGSTSHHRIVSYKLGGLSFLVRYAVDGYLEDRVHPVTDELDTKEASIDDLVGYLKATSLDHPAPTGNNPFNKRVTVVKGGQDIPHEATFELVTRKVTSSFELSDRLADLWISQTPNFITCRYRVEYRYGAQKARFTETRLMDVKAMLAEWEDKNGPILKKLVHVLKQVVEAAREMQAPCIVRYSGEEGAPLLMEAAEGCVPTLSPKMKALFNRESETKLGEKEGK
ncbi:MAG: hypothetical protein Q9163_000237 [Psora crenata]